MLKEPKEILRQFKHDVQDIFQDDFCSLRLYGSYARGDYNDYSDIDVMILVNTPDDKIHSFYDQVSDCAFEYLMEYQVDNSPVIKNVDHFNKWKEELLYYQNVEREGVDIEG